MNRTTKTAVKVAAVALTASDGRRDTDLTGLLRSARTGWMSPGRRAAAALVVPAAFAGVLFAGGPAYAAPTTTTKGICNGVVNQLAHRGTVQENLLKAAA